MKQVIEEKIMLGMGAMLHMLGGGSDNSGDKYYGRKIRDAELGDDKLRITLDDGVRIAIYDDRQSCCEHRHMETSDDVKWLVGKTLTGLTIKEAPDAPEAEDDYGSHEIQFLEVMTNEGCITFSNHNEHYGYYGGFGMNLHFPGLHVRSAGGLRRLLQPYQPRYCRTSAS
jgi:hypothetical protein